MWVVICDLQYAEVSAAARPPRRCPPVHFLLVNSGAAGVLLLVDAFPSLLVVDFSSSGSVNSFL
jgi:hypothetical protein